MDPWDRNFIENTSLLPMSFIDGAHETTSQVWFSSSARNSDSVTCHQHHAPFCMFVWGNKNRW